MGAQLHLKAAKESLERPVAGRHFLGKERLVYEVSRDDIDLGVCRGKQFLYLREGSMYIGEVYDLHRMHLLQLRRIIPQRAAGPKGMLKRPFS